MDVTRSNVAAWRGAGRAKGLVGWRNFAGHFHNRAQLLTQFWLYLTDAEPESLEPEIAAPSFGSNRRVVLAISAFFLSLSLWTVALVARLPLNQGCRSQSFVRREPWTTLTAAV